MQNPWGKRHQHLLSIGFGRLEKVSVDDAAVPGEEKQVRA
jgi:hypothetical protein